MSRILPVSNDLVKNQPEIIYEQYFIRIKKIGKIIEIYIKLYKFIIIEFNIFLKPIRMYLFVFPNWLGRHLACVVGILASVENRDDTKF